MAEPKLGHWGPVWSISLVCCNFCVKTWARSGNVRSKVGIYVTVFRGRLGRTDTDNDTSCSDDATQHAGHRRPGNFYALFSVYSLPSEHLLSTTTAFIRPRQTSWCEYKDDALQNEAATASVYTVRDESCNEADCCHRWDHRHRSTVILWFYIIAVMFETDLCGLV